MVNLTIDGKQISVKEGTSILEAAKTVGADIPTLCYLKDVSGVAGCRMCIVKVKGIKQYLAACNTKVREGMEVTTTDESIEKTRKTMLNLILAKHKIECFACPRAGQCRLQDLAYRYGIKVPEFESDFGGGMVKDSNPFLVYDSEKCVSCFRCLSVCNKKVGNGVLKFAKLGMRSLMDVPFGPDWKESDCESCGNCSNVCPTGALTAKNRAQYQSGKVTKILTTCPHCATGCQYYLVVNNGKIVDTEPAPGPSNKFLLCVKGRFASFNFVHSPDRLKYPLIKDRATGAFRRASWDQALDLVASKFTELKQKYGPESLAGFACSRSPNEDCYMLQKMVRCAFGSNNTDNCARVCHSATVAGLAMTLGSGAMTNTIEDITTDVDAILLVGSNPEEAHPVIGMQIRQAVARGAKLIVVDPRDIGLSKVATIHLKLRPGTNIAFANGMMNIILNEGLADEKFIAERTEGFEELKAVLSDYTPEKVSEICHIDPDHLREAAYIYAKAVKAPIIYCLGVTEHSTGTEGVMSMSNLALLTGKLGREGCGVNPLRGQNNVQGACDMGCSPVDFPGYQKVEKPEVLEKFEKAWGTKLNPNKGLYATEVLPAALEKKIRGLFIFGEDPVNTDPDRAHTIKCLESLDFLVVSELFMTETAKYADVVLPGMSYAEKEGTFTNTERRVQRVRKAVSLEGEMRLDTDIFIDIMNRMGYKQPRLTASQIMDEIASVTPSYAGISYERLDAGESLQWPCTSKEHPGTKIMHVGKFARGKALFYPAVYVPAKEVPDNDYPFILSTGRILYQYNAGAMTKRTPGIMERAGESFIEVNEEDARRIGFKDGEKIKVSSRRGSLVTRARVGTKVSPGETWMPFHFDDANANILTNPALDKFARIPEYKVCAVKIEKC